MRTTFLVATVLAAALPNIASAQNTRQLSIPFHVTGVVMLMDSDVFLDGDKLVINPTGGALEDMIKRAVRFTYFFGQVSDANLGKLDVMGTSYTSTVQDYRKLDSHTIYKDASGDGLVTRVEGKGVRNAQAQTVAYTNTGKFMGGSGKFEAVSGSFEGKAMVDAKANTSTVDYTGTINLVCGGKRQAEAYTK
jgi:hypothetical protein